jgi:hypothetical protein
MKSVLLAASLLLSGLSQSFAADMTGTITRDEPGDYSCASKKRVAVLVQYPKEMLPEERYQYTAGGGLHVMCADYSGTPPQSGKKVRLSLQGNGIQVTN